MAREDQKYINFPEVYRRTELNALYREIPLKDTTSRLLRKYFNAMSNLYGIIPLKKAYQIIHEQNPRLVTEEEFLAFSEVARHECEEYHLLGVDELYTDGVLKDKLDREIIDITLIDDGLSTYHGLMEMQRGKPYFIPPKKQFLAYADPFYYEPTEETDELLKFFQERLFLSDLKAEMVFEEVLYGIRYANADFPQVQERMTAMGIIFQSERDFQFFTELYQKIHNDTRMQCNRGYTPNEMYDLLPEEDRMPQTLTLGPNIRKAIADGTMNLEELRKGILSAELPNEGLRLSLLTELAQLTPPETKKKVKVGRNDPCPCGSGKKYKKCCGR